MKNLVALLLVVASGAFAQSIPSPELPSEHVALVVEDYIGREHAQHVVVVQQSETSSVVVAWGVTNAVPMWGALVSPTNVAAAMQRKSSQRADLSGARSALSAEEKALGLTTITLLNGRLSNLVVVLNQKMGLTGTNRITAASIGGTITPKEASQILQGYLQ